MNFRKNILVVSLLVFSLHADDVNVLPNNTQPNDPNAVQTPFEETGATPAQDDPKIPAPVEEKTETPTSAEGEKEVSTPAQDDPKTSEPVEEKTETPAPAEGEKEVSTPVEQPRVGGSQFPLRSGMETAQVPMPQPEQQSAVINPAPLVKQFKIKTRGEHLAHEASVFIGNKYDIAKERLGKEVDRFTAWLHKKNEEAANIKAAREVASTAGKQESVDKQPTKSEDRITNDKPAEEASTAEKQESVDKQPTKSKDKTNSNESAEEATKDDSSMLTGAIAALTATVVAHPGAVLVSTGAATTVALFAWYKYHQEMHRVEALKEELEALEN